MQERLAQPGKRIRLHFIPVSCPHLNPIERLWGVMHNHLTHNKSYATRRELVEAALEYLCKKIPGRWAEFRDWVTDKFRVINSKDSWVLA